MKEKRGDEQQTYIQQIIFNLLDIAYSQPKISNARNEIFEGSTVVNKPTLELAVCRL
ncbi:MAG: hypothetical protein H6Q17_2286 [Bacteroidetes bacterium]|nr:hypothetical protein [Bacteroidota bacterium]